MSCEETEKHLQTAVDLLPPDKKYHPRHYATSLSTFRILTVGVMVVLVEGKNKNDFNSSMAAYFGESHHLLYKHNNMPTEAKESCMSHRNIKKQELIQG